MVRHSFIAWIIIGAIAGWIAGRVVRGGGFGFFGDIVVGVVGAFIAGWLLPRLDIVLARGFAGSILDAAVGAIVLLLVLRVVRRI